MKCYYAMLATFLIFATEVAAQSDSGSKKNIMADVSLLPLIDVNDGPSLRIGVEYKTGSRFAVCLDGRYYFYTHSGWIAKSEITGYSVIPEVKYYLTNKKSMDGKEVKRYFSLQDAYKDQAYSYYDSIALGSGVHISKRARMHQYVNTLTMNYGEVYCYKNRFIIEVFGGIGIRIVRSTSNLTKAEYENIIDYHDWTGDITDVPNRKVGSWISPTICAGLKLGYVLR
jgi:hypothetical protein